MKKLFKVMDFGFNIIFSLWDFWFTSSTRIDFSMPPFTPPHHFNPFTPMSDQYVNSVYNCNTLSSRKVRRICFQILGVKGLNPEYHIPAGLGYSKPN